MIKIIKEERKSVVSANDFNTIEIISEVVTDKYGDYDHSNIYVSHDGGKDKEFVTEYHQVQDLGNLPIGDILLDYINQYT